MNVSTHKFLFLLISCALLFASCSLKKRLYTKGFYTSNNQSIKKPNTIDTIAPQLSLKNIKQLKKQNLPILLAQASKAMLLTKKNNSPTIQSPTNHCDTIILKNGATLLGTVTEVSNKKIFFKDCGLTSYYTSTINKADVSKINFANGNTGLNNFKTQGEPHSQNQKSLNPISLIGFVFSLLTIVTFALLLTPRKTANLGTSILLLLITFVLWLISFTLCATALIQTAYKNNKSNASFILASFGLLICLAVLFFSFHTH